MALPAGDDDDKEEEENTRRQRLQNMLLVTVALLEPGVSNWHRSRWSVARGDGVAVLAVMQTCLQHLECWMVSEITFCDKTDSEGDVMVRWGCVPSLWLEQREAWLIGSRTAEASYPVGCQQWRQRDEEGA